ncbi:MAG: hypothetical protein OXU77_05825 [Gammaproteobacteria bacterium]|nr:hypothetical protein [Gammaproteobacteria bacterium]MDE0442607.1 hypothetical protein [Gammaproteobacteria bacterium]
MLEARGLHMGLQVALAAAAAELRIARRTVRTWMVAGLAVAFGLAVYHAWSIQHSQMGMSAHARFALPGIGILVLWVLVAGIVFLAFDIPRRDERERVAEALDSRADPCGCLAADVRRELRDRRSQPARAGLPRR